MADILKAITTERNENPIPTYTHCQTQRERFQAQRQSNTSFREIHAQFKDDQRINLHNFLQNDPNLTTSTRCVQQATQEGKCYAQREKNRQMQNN